MSLQLSSKTGIRILYVKVCTSVFRGKKPKSYNLKYLFLVVFVLSSPNYSVSLMVITNL